MTKLVASLTFIICLYNSKGIYPPFITNKTECFSYKSGCVVLVENDKMHC